MHTYSVPDIILSALHILIFTTVLQDRYRCCFHFTAGEVKAQRRLKNSHRVRQLLSGQAKINTKGTWLWNPYPLCDSGSQREAGNGIHLRPTISTLGKVTRASQFLAVCCMVTWKSPQGSAGTVGRGPLPSGCPFPYFPRTGS